jgi:hypothetical protein
VADKPGWGLLDAETRNPVDPAALVTDEKIEMTPWEVHDSKFQQIKQIEWRAGGRLLSALSALSHLCTGGPHNRRTGVQRPSSDFVDRKALW